MTSPLKFAYWVPNVSGGLVVSKLPQRTDHSPAYNIGYNALTYSEYH